MRLDCSKSEVRSPKTNDRQSRSLLKFPFLRVEPKSSAVVDVVSHLGFGAVCQRRRLGDTGRKVDRPHQLPGGSQDLGVAQLLSVRSS
ncbi:hypothetical protein [Microcoleus sp. herbarium12]|uniref:hypothetical protein n=1 Tax=Microcoleus sp. herbarium12 TaxID=3055437 RepID=UPI002FD5521D